ncbi:uncharacterized protein F4822DRAFT_435413 [Hypoxylon trugodes]|uniref:uncharacterized protein n=1 Tax=Hypoxylon trugodes TaxID=326681 RepID=UPI002196B76E|nr:uncharacterized protein F4822DRAFT_435413 [Hypoxylon trugodes]KAI1382586.1 hypothetical protein F4822DRAFT_435413 [Hypoxylon trugodes]
MVISGIHGTSYLVIDESYESLEFFRRCWWKHNIQNTLHGIEMQPHLHRKVPAEEIELAAESDLSESDEGFVKFDWKPVDNHEPKHRTTSDQLSYKSSYSSYAIESEKSCCDISGRMGQNGMDFNSDDEKQRRRLKVDARRKRAAACLASIVISIRSDGKDENKRDVAKSTTSGV